MFELIRFTYYLILRAIQIYGARERRNACALLNTHIIHSCLKSRQAKYFQTNKIYIFTDRYSMRLYYDFLCSLMLLLFLFLLRNAIYRFIRWTLLREIPVSSMHTKYRKECEHFFLVTQIIVWYNQCAEHIVLPIADHISWQCRTFFCIEIDIFKEKKKNEKKKRNDTSYAMMLMHFLCMVSQST